MHNPGIQTWQCWALSGLALAIIAAIVIAVLWWSERGDSDDDDDDDQSQWGVG